MSGMQEQHSQFEAAVMFIDSVVSAVCAAHLGKAASPNQATTLSSTEALLQLLLGARLADPVLLNWHARSLESFSKLLAMKPELVQAVMQKVESAAHQCSFISFLRGRSLGCACEGVKGGGGGGACQHQCMLCAPEVCVMSGLVKCVPFACWQLCYRKIYLMCIKCMQAQRLDPYSLGKPICDARPFCPEAILP